MANMGINKKHILKPKVDIEIKKYVLCSNKKIIIFFMHHCKFKMLKNVFSSFKMYVFIYSYKTYR